ncbi:MAG: hypothetical protein K9L56_13230 [Clostridiales bacterium]|nr:hypothetical protein [Clostridiales bacterium]
MKTKKVKSTKYPEKIKILGNRVLIRDLDSVEENIDENDNIVYSYNENLYTKHEFELQKIEQNNINIKELKLKDKIKKYRWEKQQYFTYDGNKQAFGEYDITRMNMAMEALQSGKRTEIDWEYAEENKIVTITDPLYFENMIDAGFFNEQELRDIEKQLLTDDTVDHDNYKQKFDELMMV